MAETTSKLMIPEPEAIQLLFTREDGTYHFARWGRPVVPVIFGVEETSLPPLKGAIELVVGLAGHKMAETDPELGANLIIFFIKDWEELTGLDNLDRMIPELGQVVPRLMSSDATQYRVFRFDEAGGIRAAFVFLRMTRDIARLPAEEIGLEQAVKVVLDWGPAAFASRSPLVRGQDALARLSPRIAALIRAAYDPVLPVAAEDGAHALRLYARVVANQA